MFPHRMSQPSRAVRSTQTAKTCISLTLLETDKTMSCVLTQGDMGGTLSKRYSRKMVVLLTHMNQATKPTGSLDGLPYVGRGC